MEPISKLTATSDFFTFIVGPSRRKFTMHAAVAARQSPALETLVNGAFKEAHDRRVEWDDISEDAFFSFWEHAYSGHYHIPEDVPSQDGPTAEEFRSRAKVWLRSSIAKARTEAEEQQRHKLSGFDAKWRVDLGGRCAEERRPDEPAAALMHHMEVYSLADRYDISRLMDLSFHKLHRGLLRYPLWKRMDREGLMKPLRVCFTGGNVVPEKVRDMVGEYVALNMVLLWEVEEFKDLIYDGGLSSAIIKDLLLRVYPCLGSLSDSKDGSL